MSTLADGKLLSDGSSCNEETLWWEALAMELRSKSVLARTPCHGGFGQNLELNNK